MVSSLQRIVASLCLLFLPIGAVAQLTITSPVPRMVFQRSLANEALVTVTGMAPPTATTVEARFVPLVVGQGNVTVWSPVGFLPGSLAFRGKLTVTAGWYRLEVRAKANATLVDQTQVDRVGVGEVFVVAGQSNAFGGVQRVASAVEDRVSCLDFQQDSLSDQLLPLQFSHINYGSSIGPAQPPHLWGTLGDKLVQRLNVPVLFLGSALGGSSSTEWQQGAAGNLGTTTNSSVYRRLGETLLHYIVRTGARAVLWHQGETDTYNGISNQTYYNNVNYVIQKSRQQLGSSPIAWMISRASYISNQTSPGIITAQNQLIADIPNAFPGPATDSIVGPENRPDNIHMKGPGLIRFINTWDQCLSTTFFQNAIPFMPTDSAALITSGYTLPLTRRQGDTVAVASLRSNPYEASNQYVAQIVRSSDGVTVYESPPSSDNPILVKLPANLANGQYRLRTRSTQPVIVGTLGEPFTVQSSALPGALLQVLTRPVGGGTADPAIKRFTYRYESGSHGFYALAEATAPVEVRLERIDGGNFSDPGWHLVPPSSQSPDYDPFAEFNYIRNYPPASLGVGGVEPGRYRYSLRRQGDSGDGLWYDLTFLDLRTILYQNESTPPIPPVLAVSDLPTASTCLSGTANVAIEVSDGTVNNDNIYSIRLSDRNGSFTTETIIGSGTTSPITIRLSPALLQGTNYRIRAVASSPAVASAPSLPLTICPETAADLSMAMHISHRVPSTGQPITLTLVLTNDGPLTADSVKAQSLLPPGIAFVDASSGAISATANTVSINAGTLNNGVSLPFVFRLKANQPGNFVASAQITASSRIDPDSQPNSGTGDGQDDTARIDFRTSNADTIQYSSPNPNQAPLPPAQSNQPPTDPAKADLSLSMHTSKLIVVLNEVISVTLTVGNRGGAGASNVAIQTLLPTGWHLTNPTGLTVVGQTVTGSIGAISANSSGILILSVQPTGSGTLRAQVSSATPSDPDSTPGNGYQKGEDDEAAVTLRIK